MGNSLMNALIQCHNGASLRDPFILLPKITGENTGKNMWQDRCPMTRMPKAEKKSYMKINLITLDGPIALKCISATWSKVLTGI